MDLPEDLRDVEIPSTLDGSREKSLLHVPPDREGAPLLVGLHSWSFDRHNQVEAMLPRCRQRGWGLILPEFRGPNKTDNPRAPEACGSRLARQDIVDAVDFALREHALDADRVFLLGGSGGGHMAMMMAAYAPERFAGIGAWVGISDLAAWHGENPNYAAHIRACCGGAPGASSRVDDEYRERSPMTHVAEMVPATLAAHHGRFDPSVPYHHTWDLAVALEGLGAARFFCEIFDGGHELVYDRAFDWLDRLAGRDGDGGDVVTG